MINPSWRFPLTESLLFLKEFFQNKKSIGGIRPSSKSLARNMVSCLRDASSPRKVLEIGAGTGIISQEIINQLTKEDSLTIVEINPNFFNLLKSKLNDWSKNENCPSIEILNIDFLTFNSSDKFDVIIAGVPFNNFPLAIIQGFVKKIISLSHQGSVFAFFEYICARRVKDIFMDNREIMDYFSQNIYPKVFRNKKVIKNLPPARINFLKFH